MHRASSYNMYTIKQQDAENSCDQTLFFIRCSTCFGLYQSIIWYVPVTYVWLLCGYSHTTATRMVPAYTKCDVQLLKFAPDDGIIQSETCRASNGKQSNNKNFVHLVGLYTYSHSKYYLFFLVIEATNILWCILFEIRISLYPLRALYFLPCMTSILGICT